MESETPISDSIIVESIPSAATDVCKQILSKLDDYGYSKEDTFAIHLALEEAFSNAITHGNKMDPTKRIKISYYIDPDKIDISVEDEGGGFEPETVPDPRFGKKLFEPDGRGLLLIQAYMDVVEFSEQGNIVHMVRYKEKPPFTGS